MKKILIFLCLVSMNLIAQVAPFKLPYSMNSKNITQSNLDTHLSFSFIDSDRLQILDTNRYIWQKTFDIGIEERIILSIENNSNCNGTLFLKNFKNEVSGPYEISDIQKTNPF